MKITIEIEVDDEQELRDLGDGLERILSALRLQEKGVELTKKLEKLEASKATSEGV